MNYCINCGEKGTLQALAVPENECEPFLERGEFKQITVIQKNTQSPS